MGSIRKINDIYYIEFYARGLLYSQVAGPSLIDAQKLLDQVEAKIAGGEALTIVRHIELPDFFERFLAEAKTQGYGPKTIQRFQGLIKHFSEFLKRDFLQIHQLAQVTPIVVESYKAHLVKTVRKPKIVNLSMLLLRDVLEYGIKLGFLNDNPTLHVRLLPWPKTPVRRSQGRYALAGQLLPKDVSLSKLTQLLKLTDIARLLYYSNLIPLGREDIYN